jgi:hypothetical protein
MEQNFECKFCGVKFRREKTLTTHMCVKKQRYLDINSTGSRLGFRTFQRFYDLTTKGQKTKTIQEFIDSSYYIDFAKFGNHLSSLKPVYIDQFIDFVIKNSVALKDWNKDSVYYIYVENLVKTEPSTSAVERSINEIVDWSASEGKEFTKFFSEVNANQAAHMIKTGKLSPWILYLANTGEKLMTRLNEDHSKMIGAIIDPGFWMRKFKKDPDEVEYIRTLLEQAGL